jgi:hypothetical protein
VFASQKRLRELGRSLSAAVMVVSVFGLSVTTSSSIASASSDVSSCAANQLAVAVASSSGAYFAAGNVGIPFVIINIGKTTCSLKGYPELTTYPAAYKTNKVKVVDGGGMIFIPVPPKVVTIRPGATASFGLDYGDAYDQQDPNAGPCMTKQMTVFLPTRSHPFAQPFTTTVNINFCYAGFKFEITSIQGGPIAKKG